MAKTTRNRHSWTKKEEAKLRSGARRHHRVADVAARLGRTAAATQQKAMRMGISFKA